MSIVENPFLSNNNMEYSDEATDTTVILDQTNVTKYFRNVYLLVKRNNYTMPSEFYNREIPEQVFEKVKSNLLIHKTSSQILKNKSHFINAIIMSSDQLNQYNIFNYKLDAKNIVIPIFNIEYQNLLQYVEQYDSNDTLNSIYNVKVLNKYFGVEDTNYKANEFISSKINNLEESMYWTNYYNCLINMNDKFIKRNFSFQTGRMTNKTTAQIVKKLFDNTVTNSKQNDNYIQDIELQSNEEQLVEREMQSNKEKIVDIASTINAKGYKYYQIGAKSDFTRNDINQLFAVLNEKQRFMLFSNLMISKKYCHLVVNNEHILDLMNKTFKMFAPLYRYLLSYAWMRFYTEECIKKTWVKKDDEFIFDINTASKLPVFPFDHTNPKSNPYMPIFVSDQELKPSENLGGIAEYDINSPELLKQGICNLDEFTQRLNVFCTGHIDQNIFDGFDFNKHRVGLTGSMITACLQKSHPLMSRFNNCNSLTEKLNNYFNEYYAKSDVDVMVRATNDYDFVDSVKELYNQIVLNICKFNMGYAEPAHVKLVLNKIAYLFVTEDFVNKNIHWEGSDQVTDKVKYVIEHINDADLKEKFVPFYSKLVAEKYKEICGDFAPSDIAVLKEKYPDVFLMDGLDFKVYVKRNIKNNTVNDTISMTFSYKYKIESPYLNHIFEIFPVRYNDFFAIVAQFHLPCVRGYYDGSNVYLTPSCISAHLTFMNLDYKYMTGTKDPLDIINKNRMRGFGTWLNATEKKLFTKYSRQVSFWNNLYTIDQTVSDVDAAKSIYGALALNHKIFRPRLYNIDSYTDSVYVDTTDRYNDTPLTPLTDITTSMTHVIIHKFKSVDIKDINYNNFVAINKEGYPVPVKKWIISYTWDLFNSDYKTSYDKIKSVQTTVEEIPVVVTTKPSIIKKLLQPVVIDSVEVLDSEEEITWS